MMILIWAEVLLEVLEVLSSSEHKYFTRKITYEISKSLELRQRFQGFCKRDLKGNNYMDFRSHIPSRDYQGNFRLQPMKFQACCRLLVIHLRTTCDIDKLIVTLSEERFMGICLLF